MPSWNEMLTFTEERGCCVPVDVRSGVDNGDEELFTLLDWNL
jgi:hypothetical protein